MVGLPPLPAAVAAAAALAVAGASGGRLLLLHAGAAFAAHPFCFSPFLPAHPITRTQHPRYPVSPLTHTSTGHRHSEEHVPP